MSELEFNPRDFLAMLDTIRVRCKRLSRLAIRGTERRTESAH
jgi:hypothetical protein